jgi:putative NADPH-quinone reductase
MKVTVIIGHPNPGSFNHAIAQTALAALRRLGHEVLYHDLYAEGFDPVMGPQELPKGAPMPADLKQHCDDIGAADGIIIIHPNWWCQPPAILKGWVDRVLRAGLAYNFVPDGAGGSKGVGLLRARVGLVITTANNPQEKEVEMYGDPLETFWMRVVFGLCGVPQRHRLVFSPVILSTLPERQQWLKDVQDKIEAMFPPTPA